MITRPTPHEFPAVPVPAEFGLREGCRALLRHKWKAAFFFCATIALVVGVLAVYPRSYSSEARLFVRLGKESVSLDPTATMSQTLNVSESRESEINSELEILRSRELLVDVVERLGPDEILRASHERKESGWMDAVVARLATAMSWLSEDISDTERAVDRLQKTIGVSSPKKSNIIIVECRAQTPQKAQAILSAFLDAYGVHHAAANRTSGSHQFFVTQSDLLRQQLEQATKELRDFKNTTRLVSVEGQRQNVQAQTDSIEAAILENQRSLAAGQAKIAALKTALTELPSQQVAEETEGPNLGADMLRTELYKLQIQEKDANSRFTKDHPSVMALQQQVAETRKIFDELETRRNQTTRRQSPVYVSVQTELKAVEALVASQLAAGQLLEQQYQVAQDKVRALNDNEIQLAQLSRKVEMLEVSYKNYTANREQTRIDEALQAGRISNVNVIQPASFVARPSSPQVPATLALGLIVATLGAIALAFVAEYFYPATKAPVGTGHVLGIPVLFSVPRGAQQEMLPK